MKRLITLALSLSFPLLTACTSDFYGDGSFKVNSKWNPSDVTLTCERDTKSQDCTGAVGILYFQKEQFTGTEMWSRCTAWLVDKDIIMANMHCVATEESTGVENLEVNNSYYRGPEGTEAGLSPIKITHLIKGFRSYDKSFGVDYAYFKLNKELVETKPLEINDKQVQVDEDLKVVAVNKKSSLFGNDGTYEYSLDTYEYCNVTDNSLNLITPNFLKSAYFKMRGCNIIGGNSGSPVIDAEGKAKAIVWGGSYVYGKKALLQENKNPIFNQLLSLIDSDDLFYKRGIATKLSCVPSPHEKNVFVKPACQSISLFTSKNNTSHLLEKVKEIIEADLIKRSYLIEGTSNFNKIKKVDVDLFINNDNGGTSLDIRFYALNETVAYATVKVHLESGKIINGKVEYDVDDGLEIKVTNFTKK